MEALSSNKLQNQMTSILHCLDLLQVLQDQDPLLSSCGQEIGTDDIVTTFVRTGLNREICHSRCKPNLDPNSAAAAERTVWSDSRSHSRQRIVADRDVATAGEVRTIEEFSSFVRDTILNPK